LNLVIFDIDGTLTDTNKIDLHCYFRALKDEFRITGSETSDVEDDLVSDIGFARASFLNTFGKEPTDADIESLKARFMRYLESSLKADPQLIREIHGAAHLLALLNDDPHWGTAIATGCWSQSALFKLEHAGLYDCHIPIATCDDAPRRSAIVSLAVRQALQYHNQQGFDRIVVVGDRPWDAHIAKMLNYPFIGVDSDSVLTSIGATSVVRDFSDPKAFMDLLEWVSVPGN
jgi:phosphoglycolate phosphatase-like HAD superfamily hydrolase